MCVCVALTSDLRAKVHLHDVPVLQHRRVAAVRRVVVCSHVVDGAARGERDARLQYESCKEVIGWLTASGKYSISRI
jgi:hypothetical protein